VKSTLPYLFVLLRHKPRVESLDLEQIRLLRLKKTKKTVIVVAAVSIGYPHKETTQKIV
jgi:hypothetical protein